VSLFNSFGLTRPARLNAGFTYIGVLFAVALMGISLALIATVTSQIQQREKERQLLFIGKQFMQAINSYYAYENPLIGQLKQLPKKLEDLVEDRRAATIQRHLRKIFFDPFAASIEWGLIKDANNGIVGVYSKSEAKPIKVANFDQEFAAFADKQHYSDWKFIYTQGSLPADVADQGGSTTPKPPPAEVIPPEYVAPPPQPPQTNTADERRKRLCDVMHRNDLATCFRLSKKFGDAAGATCVASATGRYAACMGGKMLSPLAVQYQ
jgi:type II secretory pathway pseudopilin PulG